MGEGRGRTAVAFAVRSETRDVRQKAACFSVLRSFRHLNEQGTTVFLQRKGLQQRNGVGGDELLTERDVISGGLVDIRKAIEFWLEKSYVLFRHLYEVKRTTEPTVRPEDWVEERSERGLGIQVCL